MNLGPDELEAELLVLKAQTAEARRAHEQAVGRNAVLIPIMEEHGFETAGEAIDWLLAHPEHLA